MPTCENLYFNMCYLDLLTATFWIKINHDFFPFQEN